MTHNGDGILRAALEIAFLSAVKNLYRNFEPFILRFSAA
jgi:hypothetical protein